jgi:hypothetical protein
MAKISELALSVLFLLFPKTLSCGRFFRSWHLLIQTGTVVVPIRNRQLMEPLMPTDRTLHNTFSRSCLYFWVIDSLDMFVI